MIRHTRSLTLVVSALTLLLAWGVEAKAQDRTFVSIAAIPGDSTDTLHAGWMDAYALDASAISTSGTGGGVTTFADVAFLKGTDKATPLLYAAVASGAIYPLAVIDVCRAGTSPQQCYFRIELTNAAVSGVSLSGSSCVGSGACTPTQTESVTLRYTRIKWIFTPYTGGTPGTPVQRCFDIQSHTAC